MEDTMRFAACACIIIALGAADACAQTKGKPSTFQCPEVSVKIEAIVPPGTKFKALPRDLIPPGHINVFIAAQITPALGEIGCVYGADGRSGTTVWVTANGLPPECITAKVLGPAWRANSPSDFVCNSSPLACAPPC
jgi:hypothetical protein